MLRISKNFEGVAPHQKVKKVKQVYNSCFAIYRVCRVLATGRLNLRAVTPSVKTTLTTEARVTCVRDRAAWQGQTWPRSSERARNLPRGGTTSLHVL